MRIATWNLQRGGRSRAARQAQDVVLRDFAADILVVSEPGVSYQSGPGIVTSPGRRPDQQANEGWSAILASSIEPIPTAIPFERMSVAARA